MNVLITSLYGWTVLLRTTKNKIQTKVNISSLFLPYLSFMSLKNKIHITSCSCYPPKGVTISLFVDCYIRSCSTHLHFSHPPLHYSHAKNIKISTPTSYSIFCLSTLGLKLPPFSIILFLSLILRGS